MYGSGGGYGGPPGDGGYGPPGAGGPPGYGGPPSGGGGPPGYGAPPGPVNPYAPPGQGAPGMNPYAGPSGGHYEFTQDENQSFFDLASKMRFVGLIGIIFGTLLLFASVGSCASSATRGNGFGWLLQGIMSIIVGIWTRSAAEGFQRIVDTQGNDIANLMGAVGELRRIYGLQRVLYIIAIVFVVIAIPIGLLFVLGAAMR